MCVLALNTHTEILLQKFLSSHSQYPPIPPVICRVLYLPVLSYDFFFFEVESTQTANARRWELISEFYKIHFV